MESERTELHVQGMHCTNCAQGIERLLHKLGLGDVNVDFASSSVRFSLIDGISKLQVKRDIERLGYSVSESKSSHPHHHSVEHDSALERRLWISIVFTVPLVLHMVLPASSSFVVWPFTPKPVQA